VIPARKGCATSSSRYECRCSISVRACSSSSSELTKLAVVFRKLVNVVLRSVDAFLEFTRIEGVGVGVTALRSASGVLRLCSGRVLSGGEGMVSNFSVQIVWT